MPVNQIWNSVPWAAVSLAWRTNENFCHAALGAKFCYSNSACQLAAFGTVQVTSLVVRPSARVRSDNRYHCAPRMGRSRWAIITSGSLAPGGTGDTAMSGAQPPPAPGSASRLQAAPLAFGPNSPSSARPLPLVSVLVTVRSYQALWTALRLVFVQLGSG